MNLKQRLSSRCHIEDIHEILFYVQGNQERKAELYDLIFDPDDAVSYQALILVAVQELPLFAGGVVQIHWNVWRSFSRFLITLA